MSRPRLLLCCENYAPSVGGVQEVMRQLAERLSIPGMEEPRTKENCEGWNTTPQ